MSHPSAQGPGDPADRVNHSSRVSTAFGLLLIFTLACLARALRAEHVFLDDGSVIFAAGDAYYHVHRALFSFLNFPDFLRFDPCINWPAGAPVPHAPLYDLALAGIARLLGGGVAGFERIAAWVPVALGALTVLPVYALAAGLRGRLAGLGAAGLYAGLPIAIAYSNVGNPDHHAAVGLEGAILLALYTSALAPGQGGRRLMWIAVGLTLTRVALLGTWHGSLLYFPIGEAALLLCGVLRNRGPLLIAQAASLLASALLIAPVVASTPTPLAGPWSATELSLLHVFSLLAVATLALAAAAAQRWWPLASPVSRLTRLGLAASLLGLAALAFSGVRDGIVPAFEFLTKQDDWGDSVLEQMSLFHQQGEVRISAAVMHVGYYAYLLPLAPVSFWLMARSPSRRDRALFLTVWTLVFGSLAVFQVRFGNDFAAAFCVAFALLLSHAATQLQRRTRVTQPVACAAAVALGVGLWAPTVGNYFEPNLRDTLARRRGVELPADFALTTIAGTQVRFAEQVRAATPATPGCDGTGDVPDYGILAAPVLGHVLHKVAHRATPADPFGPYIGEPAYRDVVRFLTTEHEPDAVAIAARLRTPFVALADGPSGSSSERVARRLMRNEGSASKGQPHLEHFRLVTEGPLGGLSFRIAFERGHGSGIPYKLFEVVPGAVLRVEAAPGELVAARLSIATPTGRRFRFGATALAGEDGIARLRVPYWTGGDETTRAVGPYRVAAGERRWVAEVSEDEVRSGRVIALASQDSRQRGDAAR